MACGVEGTTFAEKKNEICSGVDPAGLFDDHCALEAFGGSDASARLCNISERECLVCDPRFEKPPAPYDGIAGGGPLWYHDVHQGAFMSGPQWAIVAAEGGDRYAELEFNQHQYYRCRDTLIGCDLVNDAWQKASLHPTMYVTLNTHAFKYLQPDEMTSASRECRSVDDSFDYCTGSGLESLAARETAFGTYLAERALPVRLSSLRCGAFVSGCNPTVSLDADAGITMGMNPTYVKYVNKSDGDCNCKSATVDGCRSHHTKSYLTPHGTGTNGEDGDSSLLCCNSASDTYPHANVAMGYSMFAPNTNDSAPGCVNYSMTSRSEGEYILALDYISQLDTLGVANSVQLTGSSRCTECYTNTTFWLSTIADNSSWLSFIKTIGNYATGSCRCGIMGDPDLDTLKYKSNSGGAFGFKNGSHSVSWSGRPDYSMIFASTLCPSYAETLETNFRARAGINCNGNGASGYAQATLEPIERSQCAFMPLCAYDGSCNSSNSTTTASEHLALPEARMSHYPQFQLVNRYPQPRKCVYSENCFNPTKHVSWNWGTRIKDSTWYTEVAENGSGQETSNSYGDGSNSCSGQPMFPTSSSTTGYRAIDLGTAAQVSHSVAYAPFNTTNVVPTASRSMTEAKKGRQMGLNYGCVRDRFSFRHGSQWDGCASSSGVACVYELALSDLQHHCDTIGSLELFTKSEESKQILKRYAVATYFYHAASLFYENVYKDYESSVIKHSTLDLLSLDRPAYQSDPRLLPWIGLFMLAVSKYWPTNTLGNRFSIGAKLPDDWWKGITVDADQFGRPIKSVSLFSLPKPVIVESKNMLEVYLSRDQFVELYALERIVDRNIWLSTRIRGLFNDGMGHFLDNTLLNLLTLSLYTSTPYGAGDFYGPSGGADVVYVELTSLDSGESYRVGRTSLASAATEVFTTGAQVVSYIVLVEIATFSPMLLLYTLRYGSTHFSASLANLYKKCDVFIEDTDLVPVACHERLCAPAGQFRRTDGVTNLPRFCASDSLAKICTKQYSRPLSLIFGNSRVSADVLQMSNGVCNCALPENIPTHLPLAERGTVRDIALCFSGACGDERAKVMLDTNDLGAKCTPFCDTYRSWLSNGGGPNDFYFPKTFGGAGQQRFESMCGSFWKPSVSANIDSRVLGIPLVVCLGMFACMFTQAFYAPPPLFLWMVTAALLFICPVTYVLLTSTESMCEGFGIGKKSVCRLPKWLGDFAVPNTLCAQTFDCECSNHEGCCLSCQPEVACHLTPGVPFDSDAAVTCSGLPDSACGVDSCSAQSVADCDSGSCELINGTCANRCTFGKPPVTYPLAQGPNCPNLNNSGTQSCSCACRSGQCINTASQHDFALPLSAHSRRYEWSLAGIALIAVCLVFGTWFTINLSVLYGRNHNTNLAVSIPCLIVAWLVAGIGLMWLFGRKLVKSNLSRATDIDAGLCRAISLTDMTTQCVKYDRHDSTFEYNCAVVDADSADPESAGICDDCNKAFKCERDLDGSNPRCVRVPFGEGDFSISDCNNACSLNFDCDLGACVLSDTAGGGTYHSSDCDSQCPFRFSCAGMGGVQCLEVAPGTGTFKDSACTDGVCGTQGCYTCDKTCSDATCECTERASPINDCGNGASCFQCRGHMLDQTVYDNYYPFQTAAEELELGPDDVVDNLCQIYYYSTKDATCNAFECDHEACSSCIGLEKDNFKTCISSRNNSYLTLCGSAATARNAWNASVDTSMEGDIALFIFTDENMALIEQLCQDIPVYVDDDSTVNVRECSDYMQCTQVNEASKICKRCVMRTQTPIQGSMCTSEDAYCGAQTS